MPFEAGDHLVDCVQHRANDRVVIVHLTIDLEALDTLKVREELFVDVSTRTA